MNRIYRLVWSHVQQAWVIVSERTRGQGKKVSRRLAAAAALSAASALAMAGPSGGTVTAGSGSISQSGNTTTITQGSQNLSVNWQSFNTTSAEKVNFVQPSASAIAVNRIQDVNATQFMGQLNANGQVYLINPNGILFGAGAQVNVGGLVASTLDINDAALGSSTRNFSGMGSGSIVNQGSINSANGGYVAFLGKQVANQGSITTTAGTTALAAGSDVTLSFAGNSLVSLRVNQSTLDSLAGNGGLIQADGGTVLLSAGARDTVLASVVNNTGIIQARSVQNVNGTIVLEAGSHGTATNSGTLDASGRNAGETGGTVKLLGGTVAQTRGGRIDVAGDAGGGTAYVGGNFLGAGPEQNATTTTVEAGSSIDASAVNSGNGGRVALWSDGTTRFDGSITARGGAASGDGGAVETSGLKLKIGSTASVNTLAPRGSAGNWLLDPADIKIGSIAFWGSNYGIDVDSAVLTAALNNGNVTIKTSRSGPSCGVACGSGSGSSGDILVLDPIGVAVASYDANHTATYVNWDSNSYTLTLSAYNNVRFVFTPNYVSVGAGTSQSSGGAVDMSLGHGTKTILQADNSAKGSGTVLFDDNNGWTYIGLGDAATTAKIYYTPTSYSAPQDFTPYLIGYNQLTQLTSYMAVNVAASIASKTYDGTLGATISSVSTVASLPGGMSPLSTSGATASFADKNAGSNKDVLLSGITFSNGSNTINVAGDNYYLNGLSTQLGTITPKSVDVTGLSVVSKTYDGTTAATLSGTAGFSGMIGGDSLSLNLSSATANFADANAGTKAVTLGSYTLGGSSSANYVLNQPSLSGTINKANLSLSGSKTYDGTTAIDGTQLTATGVHGETFTVAGSGSSGNLASKNVQSGAALASVTGLSLGSSSNGGLASNYNALGTSGSSISVTAKALTMSGVTASDKVYDGSTTATLNTSGVSFFGIVGGDDVSLGGSGVGSFANKNVGTNKAVTVSGYTLSGADAGNYLISQPTGLVATITKANLNVSGVTANNKTYDGTAAATLSGTASVSAIGSDVVSVAGTGTGSFADKNAGVKAVTVSGYTLTGADAGNYNLVAPTGLVATISKANLNLSGVTANNKTYDGTTAATLSGTASVTALGSDTVSVAGTGTGSFADKNVGTGKGVTVGGYTLTGTDAGNYNLILPSGLSANISKANLTVGGVSAQSRTYDGSTAATLAGTATVSAFGSDVVSVAGTVSASFADKNVGVNKAVLVSGYTLTGTDAGNYNLVQPSGLNATISKADLAVAGLSVANKIYDGTTTATLTGTGSVTALGSDVVTLSGSGAASFANKNVGTGKSIVISGYTLGGTDGGNYNLVAPSNLTANITPLQITVSGIVANNKIYDGTVAATGDTSGVSLAGKLAGDVINVAATGSFSDKNVGSNKAVTLNSIYSGADAGNYTYIDQTSSQASITPASLNVSGITAANKVFDGTTAATINTGSVVLGGLIGGDNVRFSSSGAFSDAAIGRGKTVNLSNSISGADSGNYTLIGQSTALADITAAGSAQTPSAGASTPAAPTPSAQAVTVRNVLTQVQSTVLPPQASAQPQSLSLSSTLVVRSQQDDAAPAAGNESSSGNAGGRGGSSLVNTSTGFGTPPPSLNIQNGGIQLPPVAISTPQ
ncbi:filamentous hemagglutinin family protein [Herbaspirillum rubrisubalbicans]|uniref:YDG domain-containing protein n=1 Tax=Herbaspirillum rubrisubalbicans TaxID=80842 RepID=UPI00209EB9A9|nr:YDG domain-containing protein [Herbaspirillum rubrisubalbicans]MCP1576542.1 filamentous hemagglutinin family protein [Herbaspirillum rubrisubalbicans]